MPGSADRVGAARDEAVTEPGAPHAGSGVVAWLTGLSGAGKSTIARAAETLLRSQGRVVLVLDGDEVRRGLCKDLGFAKADRDENLRRSAEVAALLADAGQIVLAAFITPTRAQRERIRGIVGAERCLEVHVRTTLATCERRDPKGLYVKARSGEIPEFTGVSAPFEEPTHPDLVLATESSDVETCARALVRAVLVRSAALAPRPGPAELG